VPLEVAGLSLSLMSGAPAAIGELEMDMPSRNNGLSRSHSRWRGNLRRQHGDILRLRQGKVGIPSRKICHGRWLRLLDRRQLPNADAQEWR